MTLEPCFNDFPHLLEYPVFIDANNVAYYNFNMSEKPQLNDILTLIEYLIEKIGFSKNNIYCICDPSLKYYIDKPIEFETLLKEGLIIDAPKVADEMILGFALKHEFCFIISNDRFREYIEQLPSRKWLEDRRVPFMIIGDQVCLSPNIDYGRIDLLPLNGEKRHNNLITSTRTDERTTLDVLKIIDKSQGEFNLF